MRTSLFTTASLLLLAGCSTPHPEVSGATPDLLCDEVDGGVVVEITGSDFSSLVVSALDDDAASLLPPEVRFHPRSGLAEGSAPPEVGIISAPLDRVTPRSSERIEVRVDGGVGLTSGVWDVEIRNPDRRGGVLEGALTVVGPPDAERTEPSGVCQFAEQADVVVRGRDFLVLDDAEPTVLVENDPANVIGYEDCSPLADGRAGQVCDGIRLRIQPTLYPRGTIAITVDNPEPAACSAAPVELEIARPATVTRIEPDRVCQNDDLIDVYGNNLFEGTQAFLGPHRAEVDWIDRTHVQIRPNKDTPPGRYDLRVVPQEGCPVLLEDAVTVHGPPLLFDVDPPVVYTGTTMEVLVRASDVVESIDDAWLEDESGTRVDVPWRWSEDTPGELRVTLEAGMDPGTYLVRAGQDNSCGAEAAATVEVAERSGIGLGGVEPSYAWTFDKTPVVISSRDPMPDWMVGFEGAPRLWLVGPGTDGTSHRVLGVDWRSEEEVTAVLPAGLEPGSYVLFATDDAGRMGVLPHAVSVNDDMPPFVEGVAPATLPNRRDTPMRLYGRSFRSPTVTLTCQSRRGETTTVDATVVSSSWGQIDVLVPGDEFLSAVCTVHVENADGSKYDWAAVSITNPAQNLFPWQTGPDMVEARRAPAMGAGRTTGVSRWAYAIGGDQGSHASALDTIEVARIGVYGDMDAWRPMPRTLPEARTRAGTTVVGRYIYLIGGHNGTEAVRTLYRAKILDPTNVPEFKALDLIADGPGLSSGRWHYRIAGVYGSADLQNPQGETLPSELISVTLPVDGKAPTLTWSPVPGVDGYYVYRTRSADDDPETMTRLAWVPSATTFTDTGAVAPTDLPPLPQGSLGNWAALSELTTERASPCVAVAHDPFPDPERYWLYAAGGFDKNGWIHDTVEVTSIEIRGDGDQVVGTWRELDTRLSAPRFECGGYVVEQGLHTVAEPGEAWVYFVGGRNGSSTLGNVDTGEVGPRGDLLEWGTIAEIREARAGFGVLSASDFLYAFGGSQSRPSKTGASANLAYFPDVQNWNSLSTSLHERRYLTSAAQESAVVIVGGGSTTDKSATRTVDWTNW